MGKRVIGRLRNGIIVEIIKRCKDGNIVVKVLSNPNKKDERWQVEQERVLGKDGSGHMWGRSYDLLEEM